MAKAFSVEDPTIYQHHPKLQKHHNGKHENKQTSTQLSVTEVLLPDSALNVSPRRAGTTGIAGRSSKTRQMTSNKLECI